VDPRGAPPRAVAQSKAQEAAGIDPSAALLIALIAVALALVAGSGLFLLLPPTI
jgi:hypothetical protein